MGWLRPKQPRCYAIHSAAARAPGMGAAGSPPRRNDGRLPVFFSSAVSYRAQRVSDLALYDATTRIVILARLTLPQIPQCQFDEMKGSVDAITLSFQGYAVRYGFCSHAGLMDAFLKKHFWIVNLLALSLLAWMVSSGFNAWVGAKLFAVPSVKAQAKKPKAEIKGKEGSQHAQLPASASQDLVDWRIFNATPAVKKASMPEDDTGEKKAGDEKPSSDDELPESELQNVDLVGTMVSTDPARSMATMMVDSKNRLAWIGSSFLDGKVKLVRIEPRHVVVNEAGTFKVIKLWADKVAKGRSRVAGARGRRPRSSRGRSPRTVRPNNRLTLLKNKRAEMRKHIRKSGPYSFSVDRSFLEKRIADMGSLGKEARIIPNYRGGRTQGYKLVGVRPGSLFRALGIRSGDVIKSVNGSAINSPSKALGLFEQLKSQSNVSIEIERRGQAKELSYSIQ